MCHALTARSWRSVCLEQVMMIDEWWMCSVCLSVTHSYWGILCQFLLFSALSPFSLITSVC
jgi:hypothetical protein